MSEDVAAAPPKGVVSKRKQRELWKPYREAVLGFRNYWYPACFDRDLVADRPLVVKLLGESLVLRRVDGKVYALEDRCAHRRVPLSHRYQKGVDAEIECHTKDTVTCWYHGFTYSFLDGRLVQNLTWPACPEIGRIGIKTYAVQEAKGLVWVYVGDGAPPDLARDVMPGFLDEGQVVDGRAIVVLANWRWGAENGFDSTHIYMHRKSIMFDNTDTIVPLGLVPADLTGKSARFQTAQPGPIGVWEDMESYEPVWEVDIGDPGRGGAHLEAKVPAGREVLPLAPVISMWLPCMLGVENFPLPGYTVNELYVPIDERSHRYFQLVRKTCRSPGEEMAFRAEVATRWRHFMQDGFNGDDVVAREGLEDAYSRGNGWLEEHLTEQDLCITLWRDLASRHHRGIQKGGGAEETA